MGPYFFIQSIAMSMRLMMAPMMRTNQSVPGRLDVIMLSRSFRLLMKSLNWRCVSMSSAFPAKLVGAKEAIPFCIFVASGVAAVSSFPWLADGNSL